MKKSFLVASIVSLFCCVPFALQQPIASAQTISTQQNRIDIQGWNNTRWGMTYNDIRSLYPQVGELEPSQEMNRSYQTIAILSDYPIGSASYNVMFLFDQSGLLNAVVVEWNKIGRSPYSEVEQALIGRYGASINQEIFHLRSRQWILPSTIISLVRIEPDSLRVVYRRQTAIEL